MKRTTSDKGSIAAIEKISEFQRFGSRLGLERMSVLMDMLGNPEKELKCIHVAGTNGKGSVCRFLYNALLENGYDTGLYTSPFLTVFNERIEYNGEYIKDEEIASLTDEVLEKVGLMVNEGYDSPTEFEVITAIAFLYFARKKCDFVVLEVGLGGRGDSTNVIEKPVASVITSISYDHMDRLGNTLGEIAYEKAGIIKTGVPVISNTDEGEAAKVIAKKAYEKNAVLYDASRLKYSVSKNSRSGIVFSTSIGETSYEDVPITMLGEHQVKNAITALYTIEVLRKKGVIKVNRNDLYEGFRKTKNIGRFEIMTGKEPYIVLDGAHNQAGAEALAKAVRGYFRGEKVLVVIGVLKDKDTDAILDNLCRVADRFIATEPENERKMPAEELAGLIRRRGFECDVKENPGEATDLAVNGYREGKYSDCGVILFAGSLYLIGKVRGILNE